MSHERHVIEGRVWVTDPGCGACGDAIDVAAEQYTDDRYSRTLQRLAGKWVRITVDVLPTGPMSTGEKRAHANASEHAVRHPAVQEAIAGYLDNIGRPDGGLERYGLVKLASIVAQIARAEALDIDPETLRLSASEVHERQRALVDLVAHETGDV